jgi:fibronectin-binding autotransporter adhesin
MKTCFDRVQSICRHLFLVLLERIVGARFNRIALARSFAVALAVFALTIAARPATAAVYTWDNGTANAGGPTDGGGTWGLSSANWWNGSGYQYWPNGTDTAQFGFSSGHSNPYTVTLDPSGINAGGVVFQDQAYALLGSTLTLATASGAAPTITVNASAGTIDSVIAGTAGLTITGPGLLTLGGANTYSGTTAITGGTLSLDYTQAGAPAANIINTSSTLGFGAAGSLGVQTLGLKGGGAGTQTFNGATLNATSGLGAVTVNGGTLSLGAITPLGLSANQGTNGDFLLVNVLNGGGVTTTNGNDANGNSNLIAGRKFGGLAVIDTVTAGADNYQFAQVTSGVISPTNSSAMPTSGATTNNVNYTVNGSLNYTQAGTEVAGSLNINSTSAGTLTINNGSGNQFRSRAGVILQGNSAFTITSTNGTAFSGPGIEDDPFWVMGSSNLTLAMPFADNGSATAITKLGPGTLTLAASCTATGATYLDQGTIVLGAGAALPSGGLSSAPGTSIISNPGAGQSVALMGVSAGNSANYSGGGAINGAVTISSGSLQIGGNGESINSTVNGAGTLVLGGGNGLVTLNTLPANAGGTYINGSGNVAINTTVSLSGSNSLTGEFYTGNNGGAGNVTVSSGTFNIGSWFEIGRLYGSTASNSTTSTFTITGAGTVVNANTVLHNNAEIGWSNGSGGVTTGILNVINGATFSTGNGFIALGQNYNGGSGQVGVVTIGSNSSDTAYVNLGNGNFQIGNSTGSSGSVTVNGGSLSTWDLRTDSGTGTFILNAGLVTATGWIRPGINAGAVANFTVNGGTLMNSNTSSTGGVNNDLRLNIGENGNGTLTINGGLVRMSNPGNVSTSDIYVGGGNGGSGTGTLNITGGLLSSTDPNIYVGASSFSTGTINMSGGTALNTGGLVLGNASGASATLNLNQGLFQANNVSSNGGSGNLYFSGGTLQISGNGGYLGAQNGGSLNFYVGQSPAIIDTNGNSIQAVTPFVPNPANAGTDGGLIKLGAGALAISPTNGQSTYQGPSQVSGGTLLVTGGFTNTSGISVASGATFGGDGATSSISLAASGNLAPGYTILNPLQVGTISPAALTSNGGILSFKLSNSAASGNDQIDVTGNVSLTNVTFNISALLNGSLQTGSSSSYDLLNYGSSSSLTGLTLSGLPLSRQTYRLDTTSVPNEILLDVSAASPANLVWLGTNSTTWNTTTLNWYNTSAGSVDKFYNLDNVTLSDVGAPHGNISIASSFSIGSLTVTLTNAASSYTLNGPGFLTGGTGMTMSGVGSLTVNTPNALIGETDLHGGSVVINSGGALGDASGAGATYIGGPSVGDSASVAVHSGGTLSGGTLVLGNAAGSSGALTQNGGIVNAVNGNLVVGGSGAGAVAQSGGLVNVPSGNLFLGGGSGGSGTYNLSAGTLNTGDLRAGASLDGLGGSGTYSQSGGVANLRSWLRLGEGPSSAGLASISGGTLNVGQMARIGELGSGTLNLSNNAVMNVTQNVSMGMPIDNTQPATPASGFLSVTGNAVLSVSGELGVGRGGGSGVVTIGNNASVTVGSTIDIGDSNNNSVSPNINWGTSSGTLNQTGGTLTGTGGQMWVGQYDQPNVDSGVYNFSGGVLNLSQFLVVGNNGATGVMNMSGNAVLNTTGEVHIGDLVDVGPSSGTLNLSGGVMNVNNWFVVGRFGAAGTVNMTGGSITQQTNGNFDVAVGSGAQGAFNQSGGTVNVFGQLLVPESGDTTTVGTYNLSGSGLLITNNWLAVGRDGGTGYFNLSGGTLIHTNSNHITIGSGGMGTFTMTGGLLVDNAPTAFVGEASAGTLSIAGGAANFNQIEMGVNGGQSGAIYLTGGLLSTTQIYLNDPTSTATLDLAGGTLQAASGAASNFISGLTAAYVDSGTTTLNTNGGTITIAQSLLAGSGIGGLTVTGNGQLTLSGTNTYLGTTSVIEGTLIANNNEALPDGGNLSVGNDLSAFSGVIPAEASHGAAASVAPVPEPGTLALTAAVAAAIIVARARRRAGRSARR